MSNKRENYLILTQLMLQYLLKAQEVGRLFAAAEARGGDVTDEEVDASGVSADVALAKLKG
jgi:hypothetical protein